MALELIVFDGTSEKAPCGCSPMYSEVMDTNGKIKDVLVVDLPKAQVFRLCDPPKLHWTEEGYSMLVKNEYAPIVKWRCDWCGSEINLPKDRTGLD